VHFDSEVFIFLPKSDDGVLEARYFVAEVYFFVVELLDGDALIDSPFDGVQLVPEQLIVGVGYQRVLLVLGLHFQLLDLGVHLVDFSEDSLVGDRVQFL
jgi:hypothetical protein